MSFIGAGFASNEMFLFGQMDMKIKLVPGDSAGIVVAYYVSGLVFMSLHDFFFFLCLCETLFDELCIYIHS